MVTLQKKLLQSKLPRSTVALVALFVGSFIIPLSIGLAVRAVLNNASAKTNLSEHVDSFFPSPIRFRGEGSFLQIANHESLQPKVGQDFIFTVWFKMRELPKEGQREPLFLKFSDNSNKEGYGFAVSSEHGALFPEIYWRTKSGQGGWYRFTELPQVDRKGWNYVVGVAREGGKIGLYGGSADTPDSIDVELLGGYVVEGETTAESNAPLLIGSQPHSSLKAEIGTLGIFSGKLFETDISKAVKELIKERENGAAMFGKQSLMLWIGADIKDYSPQQHQIVSSRIRQTAPQQ